MENLNYPFLKLTLDEKFPRLLITRRPENKTPGQNIYGAFLPTGMTRRMLDLLQRTFRLHPCELDIKGDFEAPCPEYFLRRCLAPCVERICDRAAYLEIVEIVHLILSGHGETALKKIDRKIESLAEDLEFERAAEWRAKRLTIEEITKNAKWQIDVSTMNDVITITDGVDSTEIYLTTLRRGKAVGKLSFQMDNNRSAKEIIKSFIEGFYQFYAPKLIFVAADFPERKLLENELSMKFGGRTKIVAQTPDKLPPSVSKTNLLAPHQFKYKKGQSIADKATLLEEIKETFKLKKLPRRIECFDVAHLAGKEIVAARILAAEGTIQREDGLVWEFENLSETAALAAAIRERLRLLPAKKDALDLLVVDGAKPQINAVIKVLEEFNLKNLTVIGAVKPPKSHNQISHFLNAQDSRIQFDRRSSAMNFLQTLRDAAHTLANETHRELHSLVQIFVNNDSTPHVKYLRVPTRYAERGGNAEDLSPIRSLTQTGEIILKTKSKNKIGK
jgi:excinuclease ABC subunit C